MKNIINKVPVPMAGLMLALASAGNLMASYGAQIKNTFGVISAFFLLLLVLKIVVNPKAVLGDLENPVIAGVAPTFSMGLMILSTYLKPLMPSIAFGVWIFAICLHLVLIMYFTVKFIFKFNINKVFPSYFVVYVGIAAASVTAPAFKAQAFGKFAFWFAFAAYLILIPVILYRVVKVKGVPEPALPTLAIFAAPASLCLVGYLSAFQQKNLAIVWLLVSLSLIMYLGVLINMPKLLKLKFYPSYAAFTFPFVISAIALKNTEMFFSLRKQPITAFLTIAKLQEILAVVLVIYVLLRYVDFLFIPKTEKTPAASVSVK